MFNSVMRCYVTQWSCSDNVVASTVCTDTLSQEKKFEYQIRSYAKMTGKGTKAITSLAYKFQLEWQGTLVSKENSECWLIWYLPKCTEFFSIDKNLFQILG